MIAPSIGKLHFKTIFKSTTIPKIHRFLPLGKQDGGFTQVWHHVCWAAGLFGTEAQFFHLADMHVNG